MVKVKLKDKHAVSVNPAGEDFYVQRAWRDFRAGNLQANIIIEITAWFLYKTSL